LIGLMITLLSAVPMVWSANEAAMQLGYSGPTVTVVAFENANGRPGELIHSLETHGASVAFTPSPDSGVVTLVDNRHRFIGRDGRSLVEPLEAIGAPAALVSSTLPVAVGTAFLPSGTRMVGRFEPTVQIELRYPVILQTLGTASVSSGVFLLAGTHLSDEELAAMFAGSGFEVVHLARQKAIRPVELFVSPFGAACTIFAVLAAGAAGLTARIDAMRARQTLAVAVVLGAPARELRRLVLRRVLPPLAVGSCFGVAIGVWGIGCTRAATSDAIMVAAAAGLLVSVVVWVLALEWIAVSEARKARRAIPR
jgi:hypothetical protein